MKQVVLILTLLLIPATLVAQQKDPSLGANQPGTDDTVTVAAVNGNGLPDAPNPSLNAESSSDSSSAATAPLAQVNDQQKLIYQAWLGETRNP